MLHRASLRALARVLFMLVLAIGIMGCPGRKKEKKEPVVTRTFTTVKRGETFESALCRLVDRATTGEAVAALKKADFQFRRCLPGDTIVAVKEDGRMTNLVYKTNPLVVYYLARDRGCLLAAMKYPYIDTVEVFLHGAIRSTLYESLIDLGEKPELIYRFAEIFSWEIDFTTETQQGDSFFMVIEKTYCESTLVGYREMPVVRYRGAVGDYYGIYYEDPTGYDDYYNLKGESLRKSLLKSPLKYSHISSYFSKKRYHPILKIWRPHHGLDYSAPTGTPVSSIGDGKVVFKGWKGGYGNLVEIRHMNGYKTRYGHLSRFAKGLSAGKRVKMGELIGYVGSTGLSTGAHLHFEMHKDGSPINPLKVKLPRAPSVRTVYQARFKDIADSMVALLSRNSGAVAAEKSGEPTP